MSRGPWKLSPHEKRRLSELLAALRMPCQHEGCESSWLVTPSFEEEFRSWLLVHHCFIKTPLFQESFDVAFIKACNIAKHKVRQAAASQRFWDVEVNCRRISLKSTKQRGLRRDYLHISKLTEAAWIQDCRTASRRREETVKLFEEYTETVQSIIQLRCFQNDGLYEMVEFPTDILLSIKSVGRDYFEADGPTIDIPVGQNPPDFTLKLDRSDAKITLANIRKDLCITHGVWRVLF